jgi:ectoine hydroxylase-related dioxygenase (phytanoyl-CoA dioxygenase family)
MKSPVEPSQELADCSTNPRVINTALDVLIEEGYLVIRGAFDHDYIEILNAHCNLLLDANERAQVTNHGNLGKVIDFRFQTSQLIDFFLQPALLSICKSLDFSRPRFWKGYIIGKDNSSRQTYWHQDWAFWRHSISFDSTPSHLFILAYLTDTTKENGCLRVIPRSHRAVHSLHSILGHGHGDCDVVRGDDAHLNLYATYPDEIDVPVLRGDIIVGDARLLHAAHSNITPVRRNLIEFDVLPQYHLLPESIKTTCSMTAHRPTFGLDDLTRHQIERLIPDFSDSSETDAEVFERTPPVDLINKLRPIA